MCWFVLFKFIMNFLFTSTILARPGELHLFRNRQKASMLRLVYHTRKCIDEVIQTPQISILSIALYPWSPVVHGEFWWQGCSLSKVDHPDTGPAGPVM